MRCYAGWLRKGIQHIQTFASKPFGMLSTTWWLIQGGRVQPKVTCAYEEFLPVPVDAQDKNNWRLKIKGIYAQYG